MLKRLQKSAAILGLFCILTANWQFIAIAEDAQFRPFRHNADQMVFNGEATSQIGIGWSNYYDGDEFKDIDLTPRKDATGWHYTKGPYSAHVPLKANGKIEFVATNTWDVEKGKAVTDAPVSSFKKFTNALPVDGISTVEGILYPSALPDVGASILLQPYREGFRYLVRWNSRPCTKGKIEIPFTIDLPFEAESGGKRIKSNEEEVDEIVVKTSKIRGIRFKEAHVWDSAKHREEIQIKGKMVGNQFRGKKVLDCSFFAGKTFPVFTDTDSTFNPEPSGSQVNDFDGNVAHSNATWATAHAAAAAVDVVRDTEAVELSRVNTSYRIDRLLYGYNTGVVIPDTDTVTAVTNTVYVTDKTDSNEAGSYMVVTALSAAPASATSITNTDYALKTSTEWSNQMDLTAVSEGATNTFTYTATGLAGISKTGITWQMIRVGYDVSATQPANANGFESTNMSESASNDPLLTVTHGAAQAGGSGGNADSVLIIYILDFRRYS